MDTAQLVEKYSLQHHRLPRHIAIIMDGNGRWAQSRLRPRLFGHKAGADSVRDVVSLCRELAIPALTLYAFSSENWKRPEGEVSGLMTILQSYLKNELSLMQENGIRLHCIGDIDKLPVKVATLLRTIMDATATNDGMVLTLALSYGARDEMVRATKSIAAACCAGELAIDDISPELFESQLDTAILPEPDLLIRTGGESRLSNFLLWQLSYAELYFTSTMWPEFRKEALALAIADFQDRERRFGQTSAQLNQK